jgi:hypothetical protein
MWCAGGGPQVDYIHQIGLFIHLACFYSITFALKMYHVVGHNCNTWAGGHVVRFDRLPWIFVGRIYKMVRELRRLVHMLWTIGLWTRRRNLRTILYIRQVFLWKIRSLTFSPHVNCFSFSRIEKYCRRRQIVIYYSCLILIPRSRSDRWRVFC